jgi:hypothetical protein
MLLAARRGLRRAYFPLKMAAEEAHYDETGAVFFVIIIIK